jgi:hypothetical protein
MIVDSNEFVPVYYQESYIDELLTTRAISYVQHFRHRFTVKQKVNLLEPTEINVFQLVTSSAMESALEYSNESLKLNGETPISPSEFRRFTCLCDAFLEVVLDMRLRTTAEMQQENLEKLIDRFPQVEPILLLV